MEILETGQGIEITTAPSRALILPVFLLAQVAVADDFTKLHSLVKPQRGESRWMEIEWYPRVWEARRKAAAVPLPRAAEQLAVV